MKYFIGKAGKNGSSRFKKKIGEKNYYYNGEEISGYFLEDLMFSSLIEVDTFKDKVIELFITMPEEYIFMTLNDSSLEDGENSISYKKKDFKEEEITKILSVIVKNKDDLIFVDFNEITEEFFFAKNIDGLEFNKKVSEIEAENMISRAQKSKIFLKRNIKVLFLLLLIISVPIISINLSDKYITAPAEKNLEVMKIKEKKLKLDKYKLSNRLKNDSEKMAYIENEIDFLEDTEKMKAAWKKFDKH